jgi:type IV pilus biogenesis protein CpaD/CtpE
MAIDRIRIAGLLALGLGLSACAGPGTVNWGQRDNFGEATKQTFAAQVINPNPVYDEPYAIGSGAKAAAAVERYRTDKVKQPQAQKTSAFGSSSAGSGSSGN